MFANQSVDVHAFSMIPRSEIPRSAFDMQFAHKTTFDAGYLVPFYLDEVLPGDSFKFTGSFFVVWLRQFFRLWIICMLISFFLCSGAFALDPFREYDGRASEPR